MNPTTKLLLAAALAPLTLAAAASAQTGAMEAALEKAVRAAQKRLQERTKIWKDHSTWPRARVVTSKYFALRTTQSHSYAKTLTQGLDTMAEHFIRILRPDFQWKGQAQILLYPDIPTYNTAGDTHGQDHSSIYGSFFGAAQPTKPVHAVFKSNYNLVCIEVTHSAAHQFLARAYPGAQRPDWLEEGLAGYFSLYWNWAWGKSELARFQEQGSFVPLSQVLRRRLASYGAKAHHHFIELGMTFYYLMHFKPETRSTEDKTGPFADYLRKTLQGIDVRKHPVHKILFEETAKLEAELKAYKW